jgi:hypothetical protein
MNIPSDRYLCPHTPLILTPWPNCHLLESNKMVTKIQVHFTDIENLLKEDPLKTRPCKNGEAIFNLE